MPRRRDAIDADRYAARFGDFRADFRPGQHAAMPGLRALRDLDLDHLHLRIARLQREFLGREFAVLGAAAEIAGADFPDQIAAVLAVIAADRALAGVMCKAAELCALVEGPD